MSQLFPELQGIIPSLPLNAQPPRCHSLSTSPGCPNWSSQQAGAGGELLDFNTEEFHGQSTGSGTRVFPKGFENSEQTGEIEERKKSMGGGEEKGYLSARRKELIRKKSYEE